MSDKQSRQAGAWNLDTAMLPLAMREAGAARLNHLQQIDLDLFYVSQEVFLAMWDARPDQGADLDITFGDYVESQQFARLPLTPKQRARFQSLQKPDPTAPHLYNQGAIAMQTDIPNSRLNALRLGVRLLAAAANPWSGLTREFAAKAQWQPLDPFGWPRWWPLGAFRGGSVSLDRVHLMRSVLPTDLSLPTTPPSR